MARSSDLDVAVLTALQASAALAAVCPDGVHWDPAPPGLLRFVVLSQLEADDSYVLGGGWLRERVLYLVKAVAQDTSSADLAAAEDAIETALHDAGGLSAPGYAIQLCERLEYVRYTEIDEITDLRWQHRGGQYQVWASRRQTA